MRSWKPVASVSLAALLAGAGIGMVASSGSAAGPDADPADAGSAFRVAPYVDLSANSATMLDTAISQAGLKSYTAAFVLGSGCKPIWGDTLGVENSTANAKISAAKKAGASAIISFGGAGGVELAQSCTDASSLTSAYQSVIDKYEVDHVDFDVEGAAIADPGSVKRRFQAIKSLQEANSGLKVSVTIPVMPDGPDDKGKTFLKAAVENGVRLDVINAMTMDYGRPVADMAAAAQTAADGTLAAAKAAGLEATYANIGITPMIGQNDSAGEVVSQSDAQKIVSWAREKGVGRLAFWSIGRDQPCQGGGVSPNCSGLGGTALDFTRVFLGGGGDGGSSPTATPTQPTDSPTQSPTAPTTPTDSPTQSPTAPVTPTDDARAWAPDHVYKVGDVVSYEQVTYTCRQAHTSLGTWMPPVTPALWLRA
jgi:hypothetical protein